MEYFRIIVKAIFAKFHEKLFCSRTTEKYVLGENKSMKLWFRWFYVKFMDIPESEEKRVFLQVIKILSHTVKYGKGYEVKLGFGIIISWNRYSRQFHYDVSHLIVNESNFIPFSCLNLFRIHFLSNFIRVHWPFYHPRSDLHSSSGGGVTASKFAAVVSRLSCLLPSAGPALSHECYLHFQAVYLQHQSDVIWHHFHANELILMTLLT